MSDVGVAPAPTKPANTPAISRLKFRSIRTRSNAPAPVSNQPPEKAPADMKSADHRRDSIKQAFERAKARDPNDKGTPRQARMGDNQPPEETKPEREKPEKIDLKKTPSDQPRDRGRFAPRERQEGAESAPQHQAQQPRSPRSSAPAYKPLPEGAPHREPLPRMTDRAKQDWHGTPDTVRADVHRMHTEFSQAFQRYQADNSTMNSIRQFETMAREHGTTLQKALGNLRLDGAEAALRSDRRPRPDRAQSEPARAEQREADLCRRVLALPQPDAGAAQADAEPERPDGAKPPDRAAPPDGEQACAGHAGDAV